LAFSIQFSGDRDGDGWISLGNHTETFQSSFSHFSRAQYERQWKQALKTALEDRRPAALFQNVAIGDDGVGTLWLYPIVASECAGDTENKRRGLKNFPEQQDDGVYISERFMPVTVDVSNLKRRIYLEFEDGTTGHELALYYLDMSAPERIFGYLDENFVNLSHWYFSNSEIRNFLSSQ